MPLKVLAKFNRIKALVGAGGAALPALAAALAASAALEVSPERSRVRRRAPLPQVAPREALQRTVIAENLPDRLSIGAPGDRSPGRVAGWVGRALWGNSGVGIKASAKIACR